MLMLVVIKPFPQLGSIKYYSTLALYSSLFESLMDKMLM